ncbi:MAG: hypothetical protein IPM18_14310 [Phycisphaerales bacterium]|nr:hypothetical protein [Phycisphaerales bacterium]
MKLRLAGIALATLVLPTLLGCARQFTRDNFELITVGVDDRTDVRMILGDPTKEMGGEWLYDDTQRHYTARIFFDPEGRVRGKQWIDARTGEWSGQNPDGNPPPEGEVREERTQTRRIR